MKAEKLNQIGLWTHLNVFFQLEARKINFGNVFEFSAFRAHSKFSFDFPDGELLIKNVTNKVFRIIE